MSRFICYKRNVIQKKFNVFISCRFVLREKYQYEEKNKNKLVKDDFLIYYTHNIRTKYKGLCDELLCKKISLFSSINHIIISHLTFKEKQVLINTKINIFLSEDDIMCIAFKCLFYFHKVFTINSINKFNSNSLMLKANYNVILIK